MKQKRITPTTTVAQLAGNELLDQLNGNGIVVYIRLVAASAKLGKKMEISNEEILPGLARGSRSVQRSLEELTEAKLVSVVYRVGEHGGMISRTIELLA